MIFYCCQLSQNYRQSNNNSYSKTNNMDNKTNSKSKKNTQNVYQGTDSEGTKYRNIQQLWELEFGQAQAQGQQVVNKIGDKETWFRKGNEYWTNADATYDGVLGGYGKLSQPDIMGSLKFLMTLFQKYPTIQRESALDCGAGIGRITKQLLANIYKTVDLNDQCAKYVEAAKEHLKNCKRVRHFINKGLQELEFTEKYDCIWVQWVLAYLPEKDAIQFLERARKSLTPGGIVILKQNHCKNGFVVDKDDCSVTRSRDLYLDLLQKSGLKVIEQTVQSPWPADLFQVRIYAAVDSTPQ